MSYTWRMILPGQFLDPQSPRYLRPPLHCLQTLCGCRGASSWQTNSSIANITNIIHRAQWQCNYIFMIKSIDQFQSSSTLPIPVTQLFSISWCDRWTVIATTPTRPPYDAKSELWRWCNNIQYIHSLYFSAWPHSMISDAKSEIVLMMISTVVTDN